MERSEADYESRFGEELEANSYSEKASQCILVAPSDPQYGFCSSCLRIAVCAFMTMCSLHDFLRGSGTSTASHPVSTYPLALKRDHGFRIANHYKV